MPPCAEVCADAGPGVRKNKETSTAACTARARTSLVTRAQAVLIMDTDDACDVAMALRPEFAARMALEHINSVHMERLAASVDRT